MGNVARTVVASLIASVTATIAFSLAWLKPLSLATSLSTALQAFVTYLVPISVIGVTVATPIAMLLRKLQLLRWWLPPVLAMAFGGALGTAFVQPRSEETHNPFSLSFSPWSRQHPGFVEEIAATNADLIGSLILGLVVGAVFGLVFWRAYSLGMRPNTSLERSRDR